MKKRILLISPYAHGLEDITSYPPLGLLYIASNMRKDEWEPEVLVMTDKRFNRFEYSYYGISVHSVAVLKEAKRLIDIITKKNKGAKIYVGGSASVLIKSEKNVYVHLGEGEMYFNNKDYKDLDCIKSPARYLLPAKSIKYEGKVHHANEPSTTIIATRGCVYNCSFCDRITLGREFRKRSVENVVTEIKEIIDTYGIKWFRFVDDCLTLDRRWFTNLCKALKPLKIRWTCLSRADLLTGDMLFHMKQSGCQEIFFGFESGSQKMLDLMNKKTTVEKNRKAIEMCRGRGIKSCAYMMFGFPGEDDGTVAETIKFLEDARPDKSRVSTFVPIPGTAVWENPKKYGVRIKQNYEDYWYFDKHDFALEYDYIGNEKMAELRDRVMTYYENKFKQGWVN